MHFGSYFLGFDKEIFTEDLKIGINEIETYASLDLCSSRENKLEFSVPLKKEKYVKSHRREHCFQNPTTRYLMRKYFGNGQTALLSLPSYVCNSGGSRHASARTTSSSNPSQNPSESFYVGSRGRWAEGCWDSDWCQIPPPASRCQDLEKWIWDSLVVEKKNLTMHLERLLLFRSNGGKGVGIIHIHRIHEIESYSWNECQSSLGIQSLTLMRKMKPGEVKWLLWGPTAQEGLSQTWDTGSLVLHAEHFEFYHVVLSALILDDSSLFILTVYNNVKLNL